MWYFKLRLKNKSTKELKMSCQSCCSNCDKQVVDYTVVVDSKCGFKNIESEVEKKLGEGYSLYGNPIRGLLVSYQTMVKCESKQM
jgi:hypothetical protein